MKALITLQMRMRDRELKQRSINRLINSPLFERMYHRSDLLERIEVENYVEQLDKTKILNWMRHHSKLELGEKSHAVLKEMGREKRIKNWSRLSKTELVQAIGDHDAKRRNA